jgi:hypothetical protein
MARVVSDMDDLGDRHLHDPGPCRVLTASA